ncbi:uncharacterized protein SAPINGB_P000650 [Magnusiomyces paraingens]|uniref:TAFII28-like protein domain-containing protein n=1 Tax=Magnusiomyces paraingens TaxID=2606893 RepID=A0A5E8B1R8_9ASCO|nr:uncharacterized protein SAPINGB_P000650 [Saprochaete ingens]VVT45138.1 unnamed protein product [Saprochaete ingens]
MPSGIPKKRKSDITPGFQFPPSKKQTTSTGSGPSSRKGSLAEGAFDDLGRSDDDENEYLDDDDADLKGIGGGGTLGSGGGSGHKKTGSTTGGTKKKGSTKKADAEEEEDDDDDDDDDYGASAAEAGGAGGGSTGPTDEERQAQERLRVLMSNFDDTQMSRYEAFRRANVSKNSVKKLANAVLGQSIPGPVAVALSGLSKVFVGELVEMAKDVQHQLNQKAYREMHQQVQRDLDKENGKTGDDTKTNKDKLPTGLATAIPVPGALTDPLLAFTSTTSTAATTTSTSSTTTTTAVNVTNVAPTAPLLAALDSASTFPFLPTGAGLDPLFVLPPDSATAAAVTTSSTITLSDDDPAAIAAAEAAKEKAAREAEEEEEAAVEMLDRQPLRAWHLREAWRLYRQEHGAVPQAHWRRQGGEGDGRMFR